MGLLLEDAYYILGWAEGLIQRKGQLNLVNGVGMPTIGAKCPLRTPIAHQINLVRVVIVIFF